MNKARFSPFFVVFMMLFAVLASSGCQDQGSLDSDGDGYNDDVDAFPNDKGEWKDSDNDGVGDFADDFPNDPNEWFDTDYDGVGNKADAFPNDPSETNDTDGDGFGDNQEDEFPNNPNEWYDSDGDGVGDNADKYPFNPFEANDTDGDGYGDNDQDKFPNDPNEWYDSDGDGVGNNADAFPQNRFETNDTDGDGVGDNRDPFPNDATEWEDSDRDGVGNNKDVFPSDSSQWNDTDGDGYGDNSESSTGDAFPNDPNEWADEDGDGLGSNYEEQIGTNPRNFDTDGDGLSDGVETNTGTWESNQSTGTDPLNFDTDGDGLLDGMESNTGIPTTVIDEEWYPYDVSDAYYPKQLFVDSELKVNVVFLGFGELTDQDSQEILSRTPAYYTPLGQVLRNALKLGNEYHANISLIEAPEQMFMDYNNFMNNSKSMEWKVEDYVDSNGDYYVDEAFDEGFGDDDYSDVVIDGVDVLEAEEWLYINADKYTGMEDLFDGYVLFFLNPETSLFPYYYYHNSTDIDSGEALHVNNLVAYGGNYPFYFIDMATPPPSFLWSGGDAANAENNPPLWLIEDNEEFYNLVAEYIDESIQFLFAPSYIYKSAYEPEFVVDTFIIDTTSDDSGLANVGNYIDDGIIQRSMKNMIPYTNWTFTNNYKDIDDAGMEKVKEAFDGNTTVYYDYYGCDTYTVIDDDALIPVLDELIHRPKGVFTVPVFIFLVDDCGAIGKPGVLGRASSYENGTSFGIFIPHGPQMSHSGLTQTVIHEIGHMVGLLHSFDGVTKDESGDWQFERDWFWTQCKSPMTYNHDLHNLYYDRFNKDTLGRGHVMYVLGETQTLMYKMAMILEEKGYTFDRLPSNYKYECPICRALAVLERNWDIAVFEFEMKNYAGSNLNGRLYSLDYALNAKFEAEKIISLTENLENYTAYYAINYGTDPNKADTDGDGIIDGRETMTGVWESNYSVGTNPVLADTDGDGISDGDEINQYNTDPNNSDTDYDGLYDGAEINDHQTNPLNMDTDNDGLYDGDETTFLQTNPLNMDTDGDGLTDGNEVLVLGSSPTMVDTDGDGYNDAEDYWPTFNFKLTMVIYYYKVENTDFWDGDDVYFKMFIEDSEAHVTNYIEDTDESEVWYNFTYDVDDNKPVFYAGLQAWDYDGDEGSDDDYYDIDGKNEDYAQLDLYFSFGIVYGDTNEKYYINGEDLGYSDVHANGQDDGDMNYHNAEVRLYLVWGE